MDNPITPGEILVKEYLELTSISGFGFHAASWWLLSKAIGDCRPGR